MRLQKLRILLFNNALLRITFIAGLILLVLACLFLTGFYLIERSASKTTRMKDSFSRILREYDISADVYTGTEREYESLNRELDRLEKRAIGVESWLSVLKRRRALASRYPPSTENYRVSINRALKVYPSSAPLAAIAAAALVKDTAVSIKMENALRGFSPLLAENDFNKLRLSLHVLLGDFSSPQKAAVLPTNLLSDGTEVITQNLIIMKILNSDFGAANNTLDNAAADIQAIINSSAPSENFIRFAAEYNYDFGDIHRAAVLFSRLEGDSALGRQADSIYLAGFPASARSLWLLLSSASNDRDPKERDPKERSLYNLAVTTDNAHEASIYLKKIIDMDFESVTDSRQFGLIRYSRLLSNTQALAALEKTEKLKPSAFPFIDLEICKRRTESQQPARKIAEAWLLLDRHFENEDLYRWASWLMAFQRDYGELAILLKHQVLDQYQPSEWFSLYKSVQLMQEGEIDTAINLLRSIPEDSAGWYVYANLGRILEAQRSHLRAIEQYDLAIEKKLDNKTASRINYNMARCFTALSRASDARIALEDALNIDPDNHTARLEYERLLF
jgi:tetratricopeptide (TPR) repeat protein